MDNTIKNILIFSLGAAVGSFVTWKVIKKKYEQKVQEEIDSVYETFSRLDTPKEDESECAPVEDYDDGEAFEEIEYKRLAETYDPNLNEAMEGGSNIGEPYVIDSTELGERDDYEIKSFTYYADNVLTDEDDKPLKAKDILKTVGLDYADGFDDETDCVCIRNPKTMTDYEILRDVESFYSIDPADDE